MTQPDALPPNRKIPGSGQQNSMPGQPSGHAQNVRIPSSASPRAARGRTWRRIWTPERLAYVRSAAGVVLMVALSIAAAWGIRRYVSTSPRFAVRSIRVDGTVKRSSEQVVAAADLQMGQNIFGVDLEATRARILRDPWVEEASVQRKLPSTMVINITERQAAAVVMIGDGAYVCTHEGDIFKKAEPSDPLSEAVVITGLTTDEIDKDRAAVMRRVRGALDLLSEYQSRGPSKRLPPEELHLGDDGTASLMIGTEPVTLELGHAPYRQKVVRAAMVLEQLQQRHASASVVFLDNDAHAERVVVRMR